MNEQHKDIKTWVGVKSNRIVNFASIVSPVLNAYVTGKISPEFACSFVIGLAHGMCNEDMVGIGNHEKEKAEEMLMKQQQQLKLQLNVYLGMVKQILEDYGKVGEMKQAEKIYNGIGRAGGEVTDKLLKLVMDMIEGKNKGLRV